MALEQVFRYPRTLRRLRTDPLGKFAEGFCSSLLEHGFSRSTIRKHLLFLSLLNGYVPECEVLTARDAKNALRAYSLECQKTGRGERHLRRAGYSMSRFLHYLRESGLLDHPAQQEAYQPLLDAYLTWMRRNQCASEGTLELRCRSISRFLRWIGPEATPEGLSGLTAERIEEFFLGYARSMGRSARRSMQSALRTFLRFCVRQDFIDRPLDLAVPTLRTYKLATVPHGLADAEAQRVLRCIDRSSHAGRRDYAIVQLLYTYGVRGGQVRALRLEDVDWMHNQLVFKASKHGKDILLPLTAEAGESLLEYLHSRPPSPSPYVFLTCRGPYHPLPHSGTLSAIVERRLRAADVTSSSRGAHIFRHGFATRMLNQGHSLKAIADVLGHRRLGTTFIYTKVEFNALMQVALEWP
jgi:integrase/recombinase XerD